MAGVNGRISPGQSLATAISAKAWNRAQDAADIVLEGRLGNNAANTKPPSYPYTFVYCRNLTGSAIGRWGVLAIGGMEVAPSADGQRDTNQFQHMPIVSGTVPTSTTGDRYCIAIEPIQSNAIGRVAIAGVVQCKLDIVSASDVTAGPKPSSSSALQSGRGNASILWKEAETGSGIWGLVRIGSNQESVRLGTISATWTKGQTATVTRQNGDGTGIAGNPTFVAKNYFATVPASPDSQARVACALADNTWILIAAECNECA